jgi:hypothetical protein
VRVDSGGRGGTTTLWRRRGWLGVIGIAGLRVRWDTDAAAEHNTRIRTCLTLLGQLAAEEERGAGVDLEWR